MDFKEIIEGLSENEIKVLKSLDDNSNNNLNSLTDLSKKTDLKEIIVMRSCQWLSNKKLINLKKDEKTKIVLGVNGLDYLGDGKSNRKKIPELRFLEFIKKNGTSRTELLDSKILNEQELNACTGLLKKNKFMLIEKKDDDLYYSITKDGLNKLVDGFDEQELIEKIGFSGLFEFDLSESEKATLKELLKRKDIVDKKNVVEWFASITDEGIKVKKNLNSYNTLNVVDKLTSDMLKDGSWKNITFKKFDVSSSVPEITGGRRHPVSEVHNLIRDVFLSMGFEEMEGPLVESEFWCMDAMWIPQDHPARDVQDTFYTGLKAKLPSLDLIKKIKAVHEDGGDTGSTGYMKPWDVEKAKNLILRTHSTATTFRQFGEKKINCDCKYFYTATVYRNEATDATHLAEFVQTEGFIMGDNLGLPHLMATIKEFYAKLGITKIRFKPTYNPYTEPSMEAHYYDEHKKKWYALINSGVFRPEALLPYGITKSVIAWGMGGTRVAALLNNIAPKDMVGSNVSFDWIAKHKAPVARLD
ncbi:MAG: phenylalanine--tRNA ligase subunit alpha [Candidatus Woesearchaeota archaeon]